MAEPRLLPERDGADEASPTQPSALAPPAAATAPPAAPSPARRRLWSVDVLVRVAVLAAFATALEVALVPLLEVRFPITRWKTTRDVWRHPRKYLVPGVILVASTLAASV